MITRADQHYGCALDIAPLSPLQIWVPEGEDYGGLCDRLIICSRADVLGCLALLDGYVTAPDE